MNLAPYRAVLHRVPQEILQVFEAQMRFSLEETCLAFAITGSHSHGTYIAPEDGGISDTDYIAVVVPPPEYLLGTKTFETWKYQNKETGVDVTVHSFAHFMRLLLNSNPNGLSLLWQRKADFLFMARPFESVLVDQRKRFLSQAAYGHFIGYADGQLKRMSAFNKERMFEYERMEADVIAAGYVPKDVIEHWDRYKGMVHSYEFRETYKLLREFRQLHRSYFSAYMGKKRKDNVVAHGYDVKNACHLIRLMRMCVEFLQDGEITVYRTEDADQLVKIKIGHWTLDEVKTEAAGLKAEAEAALAKTALPLRPDYDYANYAAITLHKFVWGWG